MQLWFGKRQFSAETILSTNWDDWDDGTAYEQQTLRFCQCWLRGEQQFTLHTSGSTGKPKPIVLQRSQMSASARLTAKAVGLTPDMTALICLNTAYVAGVMMLVRCLEVGMSAHVVAPSRNPFASVSFRPKPDFTALVPMQVEVILDDPATVDAFNALQHVLIGGGPVSAGLRDRLQAVRPICYHTYGMTETVSHVALRQLNSSGASDRFTPLTGVNLSLDERGCLTIAGPMTSDQTVVTNDLVDLSDDGSFIWRGRIDNVINSGGVKVQAEKVEAAVAKAFGSERVFVVGLPDELLGQRVTAVVERRSLTPAAAQRLDVLEGQLTDLGRYELPKQFCYVDEFAQTPTGKIDRLATVAAILTKGTETC